MLIALESFDCSFGFSAFVGSSSLGGLGLDGLNFGDFIHLRGSITPHDLPRRKDKINDWINDWIQITQKTTIGSSVAGVAPSLLVWVTS